MKKIKIAFVCVHNSCRSQMAEAIAHLKYSDIIESFSAGTDASRAIDKDAIAVIKNDYHYDMSVNHYPKLVDALPPVDIVVTMGCNVDCPFVPSKYQEDWGLSDPTGSDFCTYRRVIQKIETMLDILVAKIRNNEID